MESKEASCHSCGRKVACAEEACQASGNLYHTACFQCCSCGRTLKGKAFYNIHDRVYCEEDYNLSGLQEEAFRCEICDVVIGDLVLRAMDSYYHPGCFKCCVCKQWLTESQYTVGKDNEIYCIPDYHKVFAPKCDSCNKSILPVDGSTETVKIVAMDKYFHVDCYQCEVCGMQLTDEPDKRCYPLSDHLLCHNCHLQRIKSYRSRSSLETSSNYFDRARRASHNSCNKREFGDTSQPPQTVREIPGDSLNVRTLIYTHSPSNISNEITSPYANECNAANVCESLNKLTLENSFNMPVTTARTSSNYSTTSLGRLNYSKVVNFSTSCLPTGKLIQSNSNLVTLQQKRERFANYSPASLVLEPGLPRTGTIPTNFSTFQPFIENVISSGGVSMPKQAATAGGYFHNV